jgi:hypothetical protein
MEFTTSAARLHRPIARTKLVCLEVIAKPFVSQPAPSWIKVLHTPAEALELRARRGFRSSSSI